MGCRVAIAVAALSAGCVTDTLVVDMELSADGVTRVAGDSDRGNLAYLGESGFPEFDVEITNWAFGFGGKQARQLRKANDWVAEVNGDVLDLHARASTELAGVDFVVEGPPLMNVDATLLEGDVVLSNVEGDHTVSANRITGRKVRGSANLYAAQDGIDL